MVVLNSLDRFHLAEAAVTRLSGFESKAAAFVRVVDEALKQHYSYIRDKGEDMREIRDWRWEGPISGSRQKEAG
jgi:xylulose-5-phosphate/fructose-6-phosphate phosphoketolase